MTDAKPQRASPEGNPSLWGYLHNVALTAVIAAVVMAAEDILDLSLRPAAVDRIELGFALAAMLLAAVGLVHFLKQKSNGGRSRVPLVVNVVTVVLAALVICSPLVRSG